MHQDLDHRQWDYFHNTGSAMYVLLMASTGGKDWEEVNLACFHANKKVTVDPD